MRSSTIVPLLVRAALATLVMLVTFGAALLSGPTGFVPDVQGAETGPLRQLQKLLASDPGELAGFGVDVAVSGDTAVVGASGADAGGFSAGVLAGIAGAVLAGSVALGGAAWYARRRWGGRTPFG